MEEFPTMIPVAAAALVRADGAILMHQRRVGGSHGGLWEFPGGKVELGETLENALIRELEEELDVKVAAADLQTVHYAAADSSGLVVLLYTCRRWQGEPRCLVGESLGWFAPDSLDRLAMPPLDVPLAKALLEFI